MNNIERPHLESLLLQLGMFSSKESDIAMQLIQQIIEANYGDYQSVRVTLCDMLSVVLNMWFHFQKCMVCKTCTLSIVYIVLNNQLHIFLAEILCSFHDLGQANLVRHKSGNQISFNWFDFQQQYISKWFLSAIVTSGTAQVLKMWASA